jgi:hypothetical protein
MKHFCRIAFGKMHLSNCTEVGVTVEMHVDVERELTERQMKGN